MLRVCAVQRNDDGGTGASCARVIRDAKEYIPKSLVLRVFEFSTPNELRIMMPGFEGNVDTYVELHDAMRSLLVAEHFGLCAGEEEVGDNYCACLLQCFPAFAIVAQNKESSMRKYPSIVYLIHPCERDNMRRFISGTDNALHDYTEQLKYGPPDQEEPRNSREARDHFKRSRAC